MDEADSQPMAQTIMLSTIDDDHGNGQRGLKDGNFAMLTFLHGLRSCSLAIDELNKCVLAAWVGTFETVRVLADERVVLIVSYRKRRGFC